MTILACGTSWHSATRREVPDRTAGAGAGRSGLRIRIPLPAIRSSTPNTLAVVITQSGETADTLAALREAKRGGASSIAICNVVGSMATRETDGTVYTHAGPGDRRRVDQGVHLAARRAVSARACGSARCAASLSPEDVQAARRRAAAAAGCCLEQTLKLAPEIEEIAARFHTRTDFLYLGRGINYPIALEGALKLKEISYIHAEGYPAGEMKHGPIALIDEQMPVVAIAPHDARLREDDRQHAGSEGARRLGHRADDAAATSKLRIDSRPRRSDFVLERAGDQPTC